MRWPGCPSRRPARSVACTVFLRNDGSRRPLPNGALDNRTSRRRQIAPLMPQGMPPSIRLTCLAPPLLVPIRKQYRRRHRPVTTPRPLYGNGCFALTLCPRHPCSMPAHLCPLRLSIPRSSGFARLPRWSRRSLLYSTSACHRRTCRVTPPGLRIDYEGKDLALWKRCRSFEDLRAALHQPKK